MNIKLLVTVALSLTLAACAPQTNQTAQPGAVITLDSPAAVETNRVATAAWHRMQLGFLELGEYTTNVLVDLDLPQGVRWGIESFSGDSYTLLFTSSNVEGLEWLVTPEGVRARQRVGEAA